MVISTKKAEENLCKLCFVFCKKKNFNLILSIDYLAQFINTIILYNTKIHKSRYQEWILEKISQCRYIYYNEVGYLARNYDIIIDTPKNEQGNQRYTVNLLLRSNTMEIKTTGYIRNVPDNFNCLDIINDYKTTNWKNALEIFLSQCPTPWKYDFCKEFTLHDTEQSILSKMIWESLFSLYFTENLNSFTISKNTYVEIEVKDSLFRIYFDVMNNNKDIKNIYHRIGNYAVYPQMEQKSLQIIHKWFGEKWDKFLKWLKDNWQTQYITYITKRNNTLVYKQSDSFKNKWCNLNFKEYIILTCQQIYLKEIYMQIQDKDIDYFTANKILELVNCWNEEIRNNDYNIIEIKNNTMIEFLINVRGKIMITLLSKNNE